MSIRILTGDCRDVLRTLPPGSVHCCVTSPPYFGLRDYGVAGQIGLEPTPDAFVAEMVAVFREVRRVLADDGTLWLNLGDSYSMSTKGSSGKGEKQITNKGTLLADRRWQIAPGFKPKDLIGIPWMVAKALQAPFYTGRIASEADRAYLAGFLDGEGTISFVERDRGPDHTPTHDVRVFLTNTDDAILRHFCDMTAGRVYHHDGERENRFGSRPCFRWQMGTHDGALLIRELFPHLRTKRKQAALVWTLYGTLRHKNGHARTPAAVVEQRRAIADMVRALNRGEAVDLPAWVEEPPSCHEPGWYLRSDIIWHKPNPMPESVRDRPTSAHENIFLLAKSERYFFDADAVRVPYARDWDENNGGSWAQGKGDAQRVAERGKAGTHSGAYPMPDKGGANIRNVWTVATQPFVGAHFATFPPALIEPCIKAGCPAGGTVLDPFGGAGTTGLVADRLHRHAILIELNPEYAEMARQRIIGDAGMFAATEVA
jgi:DNA modification methylase